LNKLIRSIVAFAASGLALAAEAQGTAPPEPQQQLERVEITGSSIKRIDAETALPVQVITRDQIQKSGVTNVEQLLQTVSAVSSSSGLTTASSSGATTGSISAVSLHGLSSLRTLVLINGRRVAPYGVGFTQDSVSVDVNAIPLAAIERVEVLKDGASALYGSDAIAGVINFILRQEFKGVEATGEYGDTTDGGASFKRATGTFGIGNLASDGYNVMFVASYQKEGALFGSDRSFANNGIRPFEGNDTTSGNTFPGNIVPYNPVTGQVGGSLGGTRNPSAPTGCLAPYSTLDTFLSSVACRFDPAPLVTLIPAADRASLFASAKFAITPDVQAYAEGSYNRNTTHVVIQPVPLSDQFALPSTNVLCGQAPYNATASGPCQAAIVVMPSSPFYPAAYAQSQYGGTPDLLVRYRDALSGNRDFTDVSEAPRVVIGVKGTVSGWDFDLNGLYTESKVREHVNSGFPFYSQLMPLLNSGTVNLFGPNTPDVAAAAQADGFTGDAFTVKSSLTSLQGKASKDLWQLPAGPVGFAAGVEGRKEKYDYTPSTAIETGDIAGYGGNFLPVDKSRNVGAVYSEINVPIIKNLEADGAVRYDHYEGVGGSFNPKASMRYQPIPQILLRGSYGKGFRAPSLQDLYAQNTQGVSPSGLSDPKRCSPPLQSPPAGGNSSTDCLTQFPVTFGGNTQLSPEKSRNLTLGTVLEPIKTVSLAVDYFRVRVENTIVNGVDAATILANPDQFSQLIVRGPAGSDGLPGHITNILQTNLNLGITKISGFDADVKWRIPAGDWGRFTLTGSGTYFDRFDSQNLDGSFSGGVDTINATSGGVIPRLKTYLSLDWSLGPWSATFAQNFQKGYNDVPSNATGEPRRVRDYVTYDTQATYEAWKTWRFTLGAHNLFNQPPPYSNIGGTVEFQSGYDAQYADPRGRFVYGRVTYLFQ
jgi:iron complex outermembrane receptor protein